MDGIDNKYIENAIKNLTDTLGIKDYVNDQKLTTLIRHKKVKECIKEIAKYLGLQIVINLSYVPKEYKANSTNNFTSRDIVKTDWRGRGNEGITAQVSIPSNLPLYGSSGLYNFPISIRISENCTDNTFTFIAVIAHELSHILLHSLRHNEKDNEVYTDITAMILGFSVVMNEGRKVVKTTENFNSRKIKTTTYGYLSDSQFHFAYNNIENILGRYKKPKNKLNKEIIELEENIKITRNTIFYFQKYLEYLDRNLNQKISQEDGLRISSFHQAGYIDEVEVVVRKTENELNDIISFTQNLNHYREDCLKQIKQYEEKIKLIQPNLNHKYIKLIGDVKNLRKYVSFIYRLKLFNVHFKNVVSEKYRNLSKIVSRIPNAFRASIEGFRKV